MKKTEDVPDEDPLKSILFNILQEKIKTAVLPAGFPVLLKEMMEYVQNLIDDLETTGQTPEVSCSSGCDYCCYSQVTIVPLEALLIYAFVGEQFSQIEQIDLVNRINDSMYLTGGKTIEQQYTVKQDNPCVFLDAGCCSIYPVRPFICRAWNSLDSIACKQAFDLDTHHSQIETSPVRNYVFGMARELFQELTHKEKLQTVFIDIPHAIINCFGVKDPLAMWGRGDSIFKSESEQFRIDGD